MYKCILASRTFRKSYTCHLYHLSACLFSSTFLYVCFLYLTLALCMHNVPLLHHTSLIHLQCIILFLDFLFSICNIAYNNTYIQAYISFLFYSNSLFASAALPLCRAPSCFPLLKSLLPTAWQQLPCSHTCFVVLLQFLCDRLFVAVLHTK